MSGPTAYPASLRPTAGGGALPLAWIASSAAQGNILRFAWLPSDRAGKSKLVLRGTGNASGTFDSEPTFRLYAINTFGALIETATPTPDTFPGMGESVAFTVEFGVPAAEIYQDGRFQIEITARGEVANVDGMLVAE